MSVRSPADRTPPAAGSTVTLPNMSRLAIGGRLWRFKTSTDKGLGMRQSGRTDEDVLAKKRNELALQYASKELKGDKDVVLKALRVFGGNSLQHASVELRNDKELVLEAVGEHGLALQYASKELKGDKEVVLKAVGNHGLALQYASKELKGDKEVVLKAVGNPGLALKYAS